MGEKFETNTGAPQGDCLPPLLFTVYLEPCLREGRHMLPPGTIELEYADDGDFWSKIEVNLKQLKDLGTHHE